MNAEIITVGDRLLLDATAGSNNQFLSHELAAYGIRVTHLSTVNGDASRLREALILALSRSELVVVAGGLDDEGDRSARAVISEVLAAPLQLHEESWERIQEYYVNTCRDMPENARMQAMLPRGCTVFPNDHGTAPGFVVTKYEQQVFALPGNPGELLPMFSDYVAPYLSNCAGGTIVSRTVGVFGLSEAVLTERLADLMSEANPNVAAYAKDGEAILRVTAHAANRADAMALSAPVVEEIQKRLGVNVYGVDVGSLQKAVVALLLDKQLKIATAESCTAGLLSGRLTEVAGVSAVFECGVAAYSREIKHNILGVPDDLLEQYGTVSPETARAMAVGARRVGNAHLGVSITGVAGPEPSEGKPVGTVYVALADEKRVWVKKIATPEGSVDRETVRALATSHALDLTRRYLEALPTVMAGGETLSAPPVPAPAAIPETTVPPVRKRRHFLRSVLPWKGDGRGEVVRKSAILLAFLLLLAALGSIFYLYVYRPLDNKRIYDQLVMLYNVSNPTEPVDGVEYPEGTLAQFYALYARNSDVRGWVKIDDTNINYPVMCWTDDRFYEDHNFNKQPSDYGVPFFGKQAALISPASVNRSLVIYGNNIGNGQMFSDLTKYYNDLEFLRTHPIIEMNTLYDNAKWKVVSVMVTDQPDGSAGSFDYTRTSFADESDFLDFAGEIRARSLYSFPNGEADIQEGDSLLMLSTGFEEVGHPGAQLVVAARRLRDGEGEVSYLGGVTFNPDAVMPGWWDGPSGEKSRRTTTTGAPPTTSTAGITTTTVTTTAAVVSSTGESTGRPEESTLAPTVPTTTSKRPTTTTTTESETIGPTTSAGPPTTTTTSPVPTTTTTAAPAPPSDDVPPAIAGSKPEAEYMQNCRVSDRNNGGRTVTPSNRQELQTLIARIVKAELGSASTFGNDLAAQKAQAVACYTYILYYNTVYPKQPYPCALPSFDPSNNQTDRQIYDAVGEVVGYKILDNGVPICAMYHASSAGVTSDNMHVFGGALPYHSVVSKYDDAAYVGDSQWESSVTLSLDTIRAKLTDYCGETVEFEGGSPAVRRTDDYGVYVVETNAYYTDKNGNVRFLTGHQMRTALGLRSHAFTITVSGSSVTFRTRGWGHGIGMSQWGAAGYAKYENWDYRRILSHYYSITYSSSHRLVAPTGLI